MGKHSLQAGGGYQNGKAATGVTVLFHRDQPEKNELPTGLAEKEQAKHLNYRAPARFSKGKSY
jgi:hypothetical protein